MSGSHIWTIRSGLIPSAGNFSYWRHWYFDGGHRYSVDRVDQVLGVVKGQQTSGPIEDFLLGSLSCKGTHRQPLGHDDDLLRH